MATEIKLRKVGNSVGVVIPHKILESLGLTEGDSLTLTETPDGGMKLNRASPEFQRQMEIAGDVLRRYRNTLQELAK